MRATAKTIPENSKMFRNYQYIQKGFFPIHEMIVIPYSNYVLQFTVPVCNVRNNRDTYYLLN